MKNTNKKGFTLVELLVVIAILAILATVAVVGYTSFTKKAEISADQQAVVQMNKILEAEGVESKPATKADVIRVLIENGYKEGFNTYYSKYTLGWVKDMNAIVLIENNAVVYPENCVGKTYEVLYTLSKTETEILETIYEVANGETITVAGNIDLTGSSLVLSTNAEYVLDLGNHTMSANIKDTDAINVNSGNVTLKNGSIVGGTNVENGLTASNATMHVENMTISGSHDSGSALVADLNSVVTVKDTTVYATNGNTIQVYGGKMTLDNVTTAQSGEGETAWFNSALHVANVIAKDENGTYKLTGDVTELIVNSGTYIGKIAIQMSSPGGIVVINGGTFKGTENVMNLGWNKSAYPDAVKTVTINGGTFDGKITNGNGTIWNMPVDLVINGGTFTNTGLTKDAFLAYVADGATVVFEGETITK